MHGAADDVADGDGQKRDGPKQDALDRPEDGAGASDVQQVDEAVLPAAHGDEVNAVLLGVCGGLAVIRPENFFAEAAVQGRAAQQDDESDDKCCHRKHSPLYSFFRLAACRNLLLLTILNSNTIFIKLVLMKRHLDTDVANVCGWYVNDRHLSAIFFD